MTFHEVKAMFGAPGLTVIKKSQMKRCIEYGIIQKNPFSAYLEPPRVVFTHQVDKWLNQQLSPQRWSFSKMLFPFFSVQYKGTLTQGDSQVYVAPCHAVLQILSMLYTTHSLQLYT